MSLDEEIQAAAKRVVKDGYDMSVGELMSLYRDNELIVNPKFQRYFRWDISQKTKFIESLLLGIPIPPIFVYTVGKKWELVDGLQRISTILEFAGILRDPSDEKQIRLLPPSVLEGTQFVPSLANKRWNASSDESDDGLSDERKFELKRVRIRVEILKKESDPMAKYELFQRLNSGGSALSEQELRSCVIVMINEGFYDWLTGLESDPAFVMTIDQTERAEKRQKPLELVIRYLAFRNQPYKNGLDVHDYLDKSTIALASDTRFDTKGEGVIFQNTFMLLRDALGADSFRKWDGTRFVGQTSLSAFEFISYGISLHIDEIVKLGKGAPAFVQEKVRSLWNDVKFRDNSKAGVRGTTRLANLLPMAKTYFAP